MIKEAVNYYREHPYDFVIDFFSFEGLPLNKPSFQQEKVLKAIPNAIKENKSIAVKSGHGTGKTTTQAWIIHWFLTVYPNSKVPCTAPTREGLFDVMWSELSKWHNRFKLKDMFNWTKTKFHAKGKEEVWFATARTSNKPENMQGFHANNLMFVIDEASGVDNEILEAIEGSQTQEGSLMIYFGNPTQISGGLFDAFNSKRKFFKTFTFSSIDSPLVKKEYCEKIKSKYGEDSDVYRVRVLGDFPKAEPDTLISLDRIEKAVIREVQKEPYEIVELGVDVARFGDDETVVYSRINNEIKEEQILHKRDLMTVSGTVIQIIKKYQDKKVVYCNIDDTGMGGGVTDRVKEVVNEQNLRCKVIGVNNGSKAKDNTYLNLGTEMWFFMKEKIQELKIPNDNDLIAQLSGRKYSVNSSGRLILEPKEQMKQRGLTSPDRADACILTLRSLIYKSSNREGWYSVA